MKISNATENTTESKSGKLQNEEIESMQRRQYKLNHFNMRFYARKDHN